MALHNDTGGAAAFFHLFVLALSCVIVAEGTCPPDPTSPMVTAPVQGKTGVGRLITNEIWQEFYKGTSTPEAHTCTGGTKYFTLDALIAAAEDFPAFANSGNFNKDRRELAAFLAQTAHETTGGWAAAPCGPYAWGLCFKEEQNCEDGQCTHYCSGDGNDCVNDPNMGFPCPCTPGKTYHGRGPMQLSWNYNYAFFSKEVFGDENYLLQQPELVSENATIAWKAALWFWHRAQPPKPSAHDVIQGDFVTTPEQKEGGWKTGFGMITNIINGGIECGCSNSSDKPASRVGYYERFTRLLGVHMCADPSDTVWCDGMMSFASWPATCSTTPPASDECADAPGDGDDTAKTGSGTGDEAGSEADTPEKNTMPDCESVAVANIPELGDCAAQVCTKYCQTFRKGSCLDERDANGCVTEGIQGDLCPNDHNCGCTFSVF